MRPCSHNIHSPSIPPAQGGGIPLRAASWSLGCLPASWGCGGGGGGGGGGGEYSCITARSQADTWDPSEAQVTRDPGPPHVPSLTRLPWLTVKHPARAPTLAWGRTV